MRMTLLLDGRAGEAVDERAADERFRCRGLAAGAWAGSRTAPRRNTPAIERQTRWHAGMLAMNPENPRTVRTLEP